MTKIIYNDENTEGKHDTSFDFRNAELRKDEKAVTTRLANCYDVQITDPQEGDIIKFDAEVENKWINGPGGGKCNVITEDLHLYICAEWEQPPSSSGGHK